MTEKGLKSTSRLLVQRARGADAGVYTCGPNNAPASSTRVHVLSGKLEKVIGGDSIFLFCRLGTKRTHEIILR